MPRNLDLRTYAALCGTQRFRRKVDLARQCVESWLAQCSRPAVSCGGGKDSTALLQIVHAVDPSVPVYCADPPNPLPDRDPHIRRLELADGATFCRVPYPWDVEAVLDGREPYPALLKIRRLEERIALDQIDGLALGIRAEESRGRRMNLRVRGPLYLHSSGRWTCTPIASWTAEEIVGYVLAHDVLPLNPVYFKQELAPALNHLRDGTWYPREVADGHGYEDWLRLHYPELGNLYRRARLIRAQPVPP